MVASAIAKGTFKILANVLASNVLPDPVGPTNKMLLFSISIDLFDDRLFLIFL